MTDGKVARDVVRRFHDEVWQEGDTSVADEIFSVGCIVTHNNLTLRGTRMLKDAVAELLTGFPDTVLTVDQLEATETGVTTRWHADGTHLGSYAGIHETAIAVSYWGLSMFQVDHARITRAWIVSTFPSALEAIRAESQRAGTGSA